MLYHLLYPLREYFFIFNVTKYVTFRVACAFVTSFLLVLFLWNITVKRLKRLKIQEKVDMYGNVHLESLHGGKKGTPTMGGLLILFSIIVSTFFWARLDSNFIWYSFFVMVALGLVGLKDDFMKTRSGKGLKRSEKLFFQIIIGVTLGLFLVFDKNVSTTLDIPFFKKIALDLGFFYVFWVALVVVSTSNAVNFTDGLDGLAIGVIIVNCIVFVILSYVVSNVNFAEYLFVPYIKGAGELAVFSASIVGAGLGFLWFNSYPAQIFMGDVGALAIGGVIGAVALFVKKEFLLIFSGGVFVIEALSVVLQIFSVRLRGKKIFKAAPIHHHFQLLGWKESKIVIRFWIVSIMFAALALMTLKLR